jgi:hypothetical protein
MSYSCIDDSISDYPEAEKARWEATVAAPVYASGHTPNMPNHMKAEREMLRRGAAPGTGFGYFGRSTTIRVFYRALDGSFWDIVYRNGSQDWSRPDWQIAGAENWHIFTPELRDVGMEGRPPAPAEPYVAPEGVAPPPEPAGGAVPAPEPVPVASPAPT